MVSQIQARHEACREQYAKLARELVEHPFNVKRDERFPEHGIYTMKWRYKNWVRLLEKLELVDDGNVTPENYIDLVPDILGLRIICLRLSDRDEVEEYIDGLVDEGDVLVLEGEKKRIATFKIPKDLGVRVPIDDDDLRETGYSSVHYTNLRLVAPYAELEFADGSRLSELAFELQLRTVLEEAWGELDHRYRYEVDRSGVQLPDHVRLGFYNLSAYLHAAALQAEYLCRNADNAMADEYKRIREQSPGDVEAPDRARLSLLAGAMSREALDRLGEDTRDVETHAESARTVDDVVFGQAGVHPTAETRMYIDTRAAQSGIFHSVSSWLEDAILTTARLSEVREVFGDVMGREPFPEEKTSVANIDLVNALNYGIFAWLEGPSTAATDLRVVLRRRGE